MITRKIAPKTEEPTVLTTKTKVLSLGKRLAV